MKHIKLRILSVIWIAIFLLFVVFDLILNVSLPLYFENQAKTALEYEVDYIKQLKNSGSDKTKEPEEYSGTYLSGEISFIIPDDEQIDVAERNNGYNSAQRIADDEILGYLENNTVQLGKCYTVKTDNGYYVFVEYEDIFELSGESSKTIMYINIQPVVRYTRSLDFVTAVMSVIGLQLGKESKNRRQRSAASFRIPLMSLKRRLWLFKAMPREFRPELLTRLSRQRLFLKKATE